MFMAWLVVKTCAQIDGGLPPPLQAKMYFNILLDFAVGLVPFVGDLADAMFRANTRNAWTLEQYLVRKAEAERTGQTRPGALAETPQPSFSGKGGWRDALFGGRSPPPRPADEEMGVMDGNGRLQQQQESGVMDGNGRVQTRP